MSSLLSEFRLLVIAAAVLARGANAAEIDPRVQQQAQTAGSVDVLLVFTDQARPVLPLQAAADYKEHRRALVDALRVRAEHAQHAVRAWLDARSIEHHDFWIANLIEARVPAAALGELAARLAAHEVVLEGALQLRVEPDGGRHRCLDCDIVDPGTDGPGARRRADLRPENRSKKTVTLGRSRRGVSATLSTPS